MDERNGHRYQMVNAILADLIELYSELKSNSTQELAYIQYMNPEEKEFKFKDGKSFAYDEAADMIYELILSYLEGEEEDTPDTL